MSLMPYIVDRPWLITPTGLEMVLALAERSGVTPELIAAYHGPAGKDRVVPRASSLATGDRLSDQSSVRLRNGGVAVVPVIGPIIRHADFFSEASDGATSLESLYRDLDLVGSHPDVLSVVLFADSPGGEANGVREAAYAIRRLAEQKPVTVFNGFMTASAMYYLAAGATRIVSAAESFQGSIGVAGRYVDRREMQSKMGIKEETFVSSQSPEKWLEPGTDPWRASIQRELDFLADSFQNSVADLRGISQKRVQEEFGRGAVLNAREALKVGMIDDVGEFEGVVRAVQGGRKYRTGDSQKYLARTGGSDVTLLQKLRSYFGADAPPEDHMRQVLGPDADAEVVPVTAAPPAAPESRPDDPQVVTLKKENRDLKVEVLLTTLIQEGRIAPAEKAGIEKQLHQALDVDDRLGSTGPNSSFALVKSILLGRPKNLVQDEVVTTQALPKDGSVVSHEDQSQEKTRAQRTWDAILAADEPVNGAVK